MTNARFGKILLLGLVIPSIVLLIYRPTEYILQVKQTNKYSKQLEILDDLINSDTSETDEEGENIDFSNKFICPRIENIHNIPENCYNPKHKARYTSYLATLFSDIEK